MRLYTFFILHIQYMYFFSTIYLFLVKVAFLRNCHLNRHFLKYTVFFSVYIYPYMSLSLFPLFSCSLLSILTI